MMPPIVNLPVVDRSSLDNSILQTLDRCPRLAFYNYRLNRAGSSTSFPILFGVAYHKFRESLTRLYQEVVEKQGKDLEDVASRLWEVAWGIATKDWKDPPLEHKKSYLDLTRLHKTCEESFSIWLEERRQGYYKVLTAESPFELELPGFAECPHCLHQWRGKKADQIKRCSFCNANLRRRKFTGRIDETLEWNGRLWFRDFKTTGRKEDFAKKYNPDHQFTGYAWATRVLSGGRQVEGGIVDVVHNIKTSGPNFFPTLVSRTTQDIEHWLEWVHDRFDEWEQRSEKGVWVMKTSGCGHYGGCFFREACNTGDWFAIESWLTQNTVESNWDPLNPGDEEGLPE